MGRPGSLIIPQTCHSKCRVPVAVKTTSGWLQTCPVSLVTVQDTVLGLENKPWGHSTPEKIESANGTHLQNNPIDTWAKKLALSGFITSPTMDQPLQRLSEGMGWKRQH